jgi:hypothetical protein
LGRGHESCTIHLSHTANNSQLDRYGPACVRRECSVFVQGFASVKFCTEYVVRRHGCMDMPEPVMGVLVSMIARHKASDVA